MFSGTVLHITELWNTGLRACSTDGYSTATATDDHGQGNANNSTRFFWHRCTGESPPIPEGDVAPQRDTFEYFGPHPTLATSGAW